MPSWKAVALSSVLLVLGGCALAEIPAQNRATAQENQRVYGIYQAYMESLNAQRQQFGLPPEQVKPYNEWQQAPGTD